jgi:hypothetical protein
MHEIDEAGDVTVEPHRLRDTAASLEAQSRHRDLPAAALLTEDICDRDPDAGEEHLGETVRTVQLAKWPNLHAGAVHWDHQKSQGLMSGRRVSGAHQSEHPVRPCAEGSPDLLAVDDVLVAVADRTSPYRGQVAARLGLGEPLAPHVFTAQYPRQPPRLLLVGAKGDDRTDAHRSQQQCLDAVTVHRYATVHHNSRKRGGAQRADEQGRIRSDRSGRTCSR